MIRAIRPNAMAQDDASIVTGWNIAPNVAYVLLLLPGTASCGALVYDETGTTLIASGAALAGTEQPCILTTQSGQTVEMVDADLGWHLLLTTTGTESQRTIRLGPAVDLPDEIHPVYGEDGLALVRATAAINAAAHYIDDVTVTCLLGLGAGLGDVVSVPVDGVDVIGQVESITWTATPDGASDAAVIRRHVAIAPEPFVEPVPITPPAVADDAAETDAETEATGNVLTNDDDGLTIVAVNGLSSNVGEPVAGSNGGLFTIGSAGAWTFDPDGDFAALEGEETAETSVTYHASDGDAEATATLTVTVTASSGAEPWTLAEVSTAFWAEAQNGGGVAAGDWVDLSGNSRTPSQSTTSAKPTSNANVMTFDGDDYLRFPSSNASDYALKFGTGSFSILCVVNPSAVNRSPQIILGARGYNTGWFFGLNNANPYMRLYSSGEAWSPSPQTGVTISTGLQMLGATVPRGATGKLYKNGAVVQNTSANVGSASMANSRYVHIGCYSDDSNNPTGFWLGGIHAIAIFPEVPALEVWQRAEGYLAHKWDALLGVTTLVDALPSDHPYKLSAPTI